jgi:hypothetical protein
MKKLNPKTLHKATKGLLKANAVEHKRPKEPTKAQLNKKFVMRLDKKGNLAIKEV